MGLFHKRPQRARALAASSLALHALPSFVAAALLAVGMPGMASAWSLSAGGVWDATQNRRIAWDPSTRSFGNMGTTGLGYVVAACSSGADAAACVASEIESFAPWNKLGTIPGVRIKLRPATAADVSLALNFQTQVDPGLLAPVSNATPNASPRVISFNAAAVVRGDHWNVLGANAPTGEFDAYTVGVHAVGHALGLFHPGNTNSVMTQHALAISSGAWSGQTTPFVGEPSAMAGTVATTLPAGSVTYSHPRAALSADDVNGALTLYSEPKAVVSGSVQGVGNLSRYSYTALNDSVRQGSLRAGYVVRQIRIPLAQAIAISNLVAPPSWSFSRTQDRLWLTHSSAVGGLLPGESISFSFDSPEGPKFVRPIARWAIEGLELGNAAPAGGSADDVGADPVFNQHDFGVSGEGALGADVPTPLGASSVPTFPNRTALLAALLLLGAGWLTLRRDRLRQAFDA